MSLYPSRCPRISWYSHILAKTGPQGGTFEAFSWCNNLCRFPHQKLFIDLFAYMLASPPHKKGEIWPPPVSTFSPFVARWPLADGHTQLIWIKQCRQNVVTKLWNLKGRFVVAFCNIFCKDYCKTKPLKFECKGMICYFLLNKDYCKTNRLKLDVISGLPKPSYFALSCLTTNTKIRQQRQW